MWLPNYEYWPDDIKTAPSEGSEAEARQVKEILAVAVMQSDEFDQILKKYSLWKAHRVTAWIRRFTSNCRRPKAERLKGPLITEEVEESGKLVVRCTQEANINSSQFQNDVERLNLQKKEQGVFICKGRIDGDYPAYLPPTSLLSEKIIMDAHLHTLHGGVGYTMTEVRQQYWIPRLCQLTKKVIHQCHGCKRFQAIACPPPRVENLPRDRTIGDRAFQVIGIDYAGPIIYNQRGNKNGKAYILLYSCSLTRAVYLDHLPHQTSDEFIISLKRVIARRGQPTKIYSDNFSTFVAASK